MGMFDYITDKLYCPYCGHLSEENEYQSKSMSCMLDRWTIDDMIKFQNGIIKFYHGCSKCKRWIELEIDCDREKERLQEKESF